MDKAIKVFSRQGNFKEAIDSRDISSKQCARHLSPFVDSETGRQIVNWISPSFNDDGTLRRRSHFRRLSDSYNQKFNYQEEEVKRNKMAESLEHRQAKLFIAAALNENLKSGKPLNWYFKDIDNSDLLLSGNYLAGASEIKIEYSFKTSLGNEFRLDIAILTDGLRDTRSKFVIGAIEIERSNPFGYRKEILCKSAGFPLVSVDISGMELTEITMDWAYKVLSETTKNNTSGFRSNYLYLHLLLYPIYVNFPDKLVHQEPEHQYIVIDKTEALLKTESILKKLLNIANVSEKIAHVMLLNRNSAQAEKILVNAGQIVGFDWEDINSNNALLITLKKVDVNKILDLKINLAIIRVLLSSSTSLIGYKYKKGRSSNEDKLTDIWSYLHLEEEIGKRPYEWCKKRIKILPKRLNEPLQSIVDIIDELKDK